MRACSSTAGTSCVLFHVFLCRAFPRELKKTLEDPRRVKCGVGAGNDAAKLARDYGVSCAGVVELKHLALAKTGRSFSLDRLCVHVLHRTLSKDLKVRCGNWEAPLKEAQLVYACLDVHASLLCYEALSALPTLPGREAALAGGAAGPSARTAVPADGCGAGGSSSKLEAYRAWRAGGKPVRSH